MNRNPTLPEGWSACIESLSGNDLAIFKLLLFVESKSVEESLLKDGSRYTNSHLFDFAKDENG